MNPASQMRSATFNGISSIVALKKASLAWAIGQVSDAARCSGSHLLATHMSLKILTSSTVTKQIETPFLPNLPDLPILCK